MLYIYCGIHKKNVHVTTIYNACKIAKIREINTRQTIKERNVV